jgi:adenine phosphoribosyltransferase
LSKFSKERNFIHVFIILFNTEKIKFEYIFLNFSDVFGVFANPKAHRALIDLILNRLKNQNTQIDAVAGLEARGFIFGPQIALELQVPFVPVRKLGKLPGKVAKIDYDLEYGNINLPIRQKENFRNYFLGQDTIEMQANVLKPGTKVLLVDDLLATGGQFFHYY